MGKGSPPPPASTPPGAPAADGGAVAPCPCTECKITSQTVATVPSNRARIKIGVGEPVTLTFSLGAATWAVAAAPDTAGSLSGTSGATVTYTAGDRADTVTITAVGGGCKSTLVLTVIEPKDVLMIRQPGTQGYHTRNTVSTGFIGDIYILPADVSFEHISYLEEEAYGVGTGCYKKFLEDNNVGHHPNPNPIPVGPPTSDTSGSKVNGFDQVAVFGASKCVGTMTTSIPWKFQVGGGTLKQFKVVDQVSTTDAAGNATITKARASNSSALTDATEKDAQFN